MPDTSPEKTPNVPTNERPVISVENQKGSLPDSFEAGFGYVSEEEIAADLNSDPTLLDKIMSEGGETVPQ
jgi:hypothetical protein